MAITIEIAPERIRQRSVGFSTFFRLFVAVSLVSVVGMIQAQDKRPATETKPQTFPARGLVRVVGDRLTVDVENVSLRDLLQRVAGQTDLTLMLSGVLEDRISIAFHELPLDDGLRRILRNRNFAIEYAEQTKTARRPGWLWIFSAGTEDRRAPGYSSEHPRQDVETDIETLRTALASDDPSTRGEAVEALGDSESPEAVAPLRLALRDHDEQVREAAVAALTNIGSDEAVKALTIALRDREAWLREIAVTALGEIGSKSAIRVLKQALTDEDESVRETVAATLEELNH